MSHIVQIQTEVRDPVAVTAACSRLRLPQPLQGKFQLFGTEVAGLGVQLPKWRYPLVCDLSSGQVRFDNFEGRWGEQVHLDNFLQIHAIEKARIEARKKGHTVTEQALADGSIKLTIQVGGAV
ncbi:MAG: hypothetical protein JWN70_207 [Planctomycetaceae bacterium]|nr:hypothetical protein [Planctomycetaceae bacterium]